MEQRIKLAVGDTQNYFAIHLRSALAHKTSAFTFAIEARNQQELLHQLSLTKVDVTILDASSELYGAKVVKAIKSDFPQVKLLLLNRHSEEEVMLEYIRMGVHGVLMRKDDAVMLSQAIEHVHEKGNFICEELSHFMFRLIAERGVKEKVAAHSLTIREIEIVKLIAREKTSKQIAIDLDISEKTVEGHRERVLLKTGARNSVGIVLYAYKKGLL